MTSKRFLHLLTRLRVRSQAGERAPHKPLLLLLAMGNLCRGEPRLLPYGNIAVRLIDLLARFGPYTYRRSRRPQDPIYRLQFDDLWELHGHVPPVGEDGAPSHKQLKRSDVSAGFPEEVHSLLVAHPEVMWMGAQYLLDSYFAESLHDDLVTDVGIHRVMQPASRSSRKRNPEFRREVIRAYEHRCAVCDYDIRLDNNLMGLEAAHIQRLGPMHPPP